MIRMLLDFSVVAPGGSRSYTIGFLKALGTVGAPAGAECMVLLPTDDGELASVAAELLQGGIRVQWVRSSGPGTWIGRLCSQMVLPLQALRYRPHCVFVPREVAPLLLRRPFVILARNRNVWERQGSSIMERVRWLLRNCTGRAAAYRADRILAPSYAFARSLPVEPKKVRVVPHGCDLAAFEAPPRVGPTDGAPLRIIALGTVSRHKRFDRVVERVCALRESGVPAMVALWGPTPDTDEAQCLRVLGEQLLGEDPLRGAIDREQRAAVFHQADVLAVGSSFESFGMTIVEAQRTSTVVWGPESDLMRELCGDSAVTFAENSDPQAAADALVDALPDLPLLAAAGIKNAAAFTWKRCVTLTMDHIVAIAHQST